MQGYRQRTKRNVMDSNGSLIIYFRELTGGTSETLRFCERLGKPAFTVDGAQASADNAAATAIDFIAQHCISVLNVAGPRESGYATASQYAKRLVSAIIVRQSPPENGRCPKQC